MLFQDFQIQHLLFQSLLIFFHKEYNLPFASMGLKEDLREIKKNKDFSAKREEILEMIWNMEEEIMGKDI